VINVPDEIIRHVQVRVVVQTEFKAAWQSHGSGARESVSIWRPETSSSFIQKNRLRLSLGYYCCPGHQNPAETGVEHLTLELIESKGSGLGGSKYLPSILANFCPHPIRWKQVWYKLKAEEPLYIWRAVPPSSKYIAVGMVTTTTDDPPTCDLIRCIPKSWCSDVSDLPRLIWEDNGTGGRPGSIWTQGSVDDRLELDGGSVALNTFVATPGHNAPAPGLFKLQRLWRKQFFLRPEQVASGSNNTSSEISYEGWLQKMNAGIVVDTWNRRYFVLQETELRYYDKETDTDAKVVLSLQSLRLDTAPEVSAKTGKPHSFTLAINAENISKKQKAKALADKLYTLVAPDAAAFTRWISALRSAISRSQELNWIADSIVSAERDDPARRDRLLSLAPAAPAPAPASAIWDPFD
jgi:hypothetical protein